MRILVTGGAGYIGSHTCVELLNNGYDVVVVDNLSNSNEVSLERVKKITGKDIKFYKADILDKAALDKIFSENKIDSVIHFAGLKAVGESVAIPLKYFHNNITGTLMLLESMKEHNVKKIVFSSSATVYGNPSTVPITEDMPTSATNPYGRTKLMLEEIFRDLFVSDNTWRISLLRYFNPVGAHKSGLIGEDPCGIPNNLMPFITQVASGKLQRLRVFGNDYNTKDGSGVRDYIHVVDLAKGHLCALEYLNIMEPGVYTHNLGTGNGYSVLDIIAAFEKANDIKIPFEIAPRRPGDIATCYADPQKAKKELMWQAEKDIVEMCRDSWNWQKNNPKGYSD